MDLHQLEQIIQDRAAASPENSYTARLLEKGLAAIARKVVEESGECVGAAIAADHDHLAEEAADLFYHTLVMLRHQGVSLSEVMAVLEERHQQKP
jgi:phosphoribosyl-ATP pyrophosphohydrolase